MNHEVGIAMLRNILVQVKLSWIAPEASRNLMLPDFKTIGT
jgi:hypothetical protein